MNPYAKHVRRVLGDIKKFPHKMASEYPEEWLCRILEALKIWLSDRKEGTVHDWEYTHQYAATYIEVAQVALRETLDERIKFFQENVILSSEDVRAENARLMDENAKLKAENGLLSELVRARSRSVFDRVAGVVGQIGTEKESPSPAARPSGLVARSTELGTQSAKRRLFAKANPSRRLSDHLAEIDSPPDPDSSGSSSPSS